MSDEVVREHEVYFATLAEQAERYDEMAGHMRTAALFDQEMDAEERNLLAVAFKQAVGQRRASWRIVCASEQEEQAKGNLMTTATAKQYRKKIEGELTGLCQTVLALLTDRLIPSSTSSEAKVSFYKAQGDYYRYMAEILDDLDKTRATTAAKEAYEDGTKIAETSLKVTSPFRLGLALNHAVFYYEVMKAPTDAVRIGRKAFEDAVREIDNLGENGAKDSALVMQLLRDNLTLWRYEVKFYFSCTSRGVTHDKELIAFAADAVFSVPALRRTSGLGLDTRRPPSEAPGATGAAMGNAQARQRALASRGGSGTMLPMTGPPTMMPPGGPLLDTSATTQAGVEGDDRIPVVFTWTQGGQIVFLAASFNGWRDQIPMVRSGQEFAVVQDIPRGVHQYKFIVDDHWRFAPDQPKTQDSQGNMNNVLDISNYQRFQVGIYDEKEAPLKFGQMIPDPNDYTLDAPVIPMVLHKSPYAALPPRPQISGSLPLSIPNHSICDHVYLHDRLDDDAPATVVVTHRYGQKYSTTVFAMRSNFGDSTDRSSAAPPVAGFNSLKAAVRGIGR
ncbi:unnamed protein product [Polarella glacialis]|uniref:14-3-3 domain-containing protein n=1 Tax=Polarella glacialis TaxID=89957 RepID=A0A813LIA8_POLGL|nr:unnamed protein product [Polarella glacialis]